MPNNLTLNGAVFSASPKKFGAGALNGGFATAPVSVLPTGGFTIDCWISTPDGSGYAAAISSAGTFWIGNYGGVLSVRYGSPEIGIGSGSIGDGVPHHIRFQAGSFGAELAVDGIIIGTSATSLSASGASFDNLLCFRSYQSSGNFPWPGGLDEVVVFSGRLSTGNFTPPTAPWVGNETNLVALWHLDADGTDSVGNTTATPTPTPTPAPANTANILPNDPGLLYSPGVWDVTAARAKTINSGAAFRTLIVGGATSVALQFDVSGNDTPLSQIMARVDRGPWAVAPLAATVNVPMPAGNAWGKHLLEFMVKSTTESKSRWSPQLTAISFTGIVTTPTACSATSVQARPLRGLVFGDSITEGVASLSRNNVNDTDQHDASVAWSHLLGEMLGAEVGVIGFGATGFGATGSGGVPPIGTSYSLLWGGGPARSFAGLDFIVINEGTNDGSSNTTAPCTALLNALLAASSARIFVMRPLNGAQAANLQAGIAACSSSGRVSYIDTNGWWSGSDSADGLHPYGYASLTSIAPRLAAAIRPALGGTVNNRWTHL